MAFTPRAQRLSVDPAAVVANPKPQVAGIFHFNFYVLRAGMPEVILGEGKTPAQVAGIFARLAKHGGNVLATRVGEKQFAAVKKKVRGVEYRADAAGYPAADQIMYQGVCLPCHPTMTEEDCTYLYGVLDQFVADNYER